MSGALCALIVSAASAASGSPATTSYTLTSLGVSNAGDGGSTMDRKFFGFGHDRFGIDINGTLNSDVCGDYTVEEMQEYTIFDTADGSYGTITSRIVNLEMRGGPAPLVKASITSLTCPGSQVLLSSASSFSAQSDGGTWSWAVTTNAGNETTADYMSSGTAIITV